MGFIHTKNKPYLLHSVCEDNFHKLLKLIPELKELTTGAVGLSEAKPTLYLTVLEKSPYTALLELSHRFDQKLELDHEPALQIRVYFDAQCAEVLSHHERPEIKEALERSATANDVTEYKWQLNYFFDKWLTHCMKSGYRFIPDPTFTKIDFASVS